MDAALERDIQRSIGLLQQGVPAHQVLSALAANVQSRAGGGKTGCASCGAAHALCPSCYAKLKAGQIAVDFLSGLTGGSGSQGPPGSGRLPQGQAGQGPPTFMPDEAAAGMRYREPPIGPTYEDLHRPGHVPPPPPGPQNF